MSKEKFISAITASYPTVASSIYLGAGLLDGEIVPEAKVNLPLRMMNRHGLVTGATGSGKTRTLQLMAEQLSAAGVPVFIPDMKGDLSGMAKESATNEKLMERAKALGINYAPSGFPLEIYSLSGKLGAQMRATVTEFGPVLLSVSDVQSQPMIFSTFMLSLLAELYQKLPEADDLDKPKLVFFLDEAHLLFNDAPKAFMDQIEQVIRLIRSKGVGIFFCTAEPIGAVQEIQRYRGSPECV